MKGKENEYKRFGKIEFHTEEIKKMKHADFVKKYEPFLKGFDVNKVALELGIKTPKDKIKI